MTDNIKPWNKPKPKAPEPQPLPTVPVQAEAERFLKAFDPQATRFTFQTFDENRERKEANKKTKAKAYDPLAKLFHGSLSDYYGVLTDFNARNAGIYFAVNKTNFKGRKEKNIEHVRALFIDLDGSPLEPVTSSANIPQPHIIVESSPSRWHCYWLVEQFKLEDFSAAQKILAHHFNGDPSVHDLPRVMRLPGFMHVKDKTKPFFSHIISINQAPPYSAIKLLAKLKPLALPLPAPAPVGRPKGPVKPSTTAKKLCGAAMLKLDLWVPKLFPEAILTAEGGYRISSALLGRPNEEDLSIHPKGIKDFGVHDLGDPREGSRSPLDLVMEFLGKDFDESLEWLHDAMGGDATIIMRGGSLIPIVNRIERVLLEANIPIYQRGGELVTPIKFGNEDQGEVKRESNAVVLHSVEPTWLIKKFASVIKWGRMDAKGNIKKCDPDFKYADTLLSSKDEWKFPYLHGVITAPTLSAQGDIIETPGYHPASGLLLDFKEGDFPPIPPNPTKAQAQQALAILAHPLRGFPFVDAASGAVALSSILSTLIRPSLRTVPLHGFDAPVAGTGKSILAELAGLLATGTKPPSMSQGKTPEEDEKRLATVLHAGDSTILLDNCERPVHGDFLCSMLTQETVQARILGQSERRLLPCTALVVATGNNLVFSGDVSRRAIKCQMDAQQERPDQREFDFDAQKEVKANRPALLIAGLTILRAYHVAGRPTKLKPMGSFEDWAWVRGALVWLGQADPADTREAILEADPRKSELADVLTAWEKVYGDQAVTLADIGHMNGFRLAEDGSGMDVIDLDAAKDELRTVLVETTGKRDWNARAISWWLRKNARRIVSGRCFLQGKETNFGVFWQIYYANQLDSRKSQLQGL